MESLGAFPSGEWEFFGKIFATELEHELFTPPQFLGQNSSSILLGDDDDGLNNIGLIQSTFCSEVASENDENMFCSNLQYISSQKSSYNSSNNCSEDTNNNVFIANQGLTTTNFYYSRYPDHVDASISMDYFCMDEKNLAPFVPSMSDIVMKESVKFNEDIVGSDDKLENSDQSQMEPMISPTTKHFQLKRKIEEPEQEVPDKTENRSKNQKKKPCVSKDVQVCMKNARSRKNQKVARRNGRNETEDTYNEGLLSEHGQSSSSNISEDDYNNASQENSVGSALNSNGKPRASRGSATDPQSLYARKRRERINERLRILQNLVPNGTKVDISTMLEEAVNYVKFLQLQIKLLSSDDLWMYAPLAYNGLDIGLNFNLKNSTTLRE